MQPTEPEPVIEELCRRLEETNALLKLHLDLAQNWKIRLRNGLLTGLGGVIGATLLVSIILGVIRPLQGLDRLGPILERLERDIDQR